MDLLFLTKGFLDWNGSNDDVIFRLDWWCSVSKTVCFPKSFLCNLISEIKKAQNSYLQSSQNSPYIASIPDVRKTVAVTKKYSAMPTAYHLVHQKRSPYLVTLTQSFFYRYNTNKDGVAPTTTDKNLDYSAPHFFNGEWGSAERLFRFYISTDDHQNDVQKLESFVRNAQRRQELRWHCKRRNQQFLLLCDNIKRRVLRCFSTSFTLHSDTMALHQEINSQEPNIAEKSSCQTLCPSKIYCFTYGTFHFMKDARDGYFIMTNDSLDRHEKSIRFYRNSLKNLYFALKDACEQAIELRNNPNFQTLPDGEYFSKEITSHSLRKAVPMRVIVEVVILERKLYVYVKNQWFNRNPQVEKNACPTVAYPLVNTKNNSGNWEHCKGAFRIDPDRDNLQEFRNFIETYLNVKLQNSVACKLENDRQKATNFSATVNATTVANDNNSNNNVNNVIQQPSQLTETLV